MEVIEGMVGIQDVFTLKNILIYFLIVNLLGIFVMWLDKQKAKKGKWRIPENTLFIFAGIGGSIGTILGMYLFRHKTKKLKFTIGFWAILILQIIMIIYFNIK